MTDARAQSWAQLTSTEWDMLIVGGGIAGAALLREATARGLRAALIEQRDYAWGSSGRSSKLIHGGMRYLAQGQFGLTRMLLRERDRLLEETQGLVQPLPFLLSISASRPIDRFAFQYAVTMYDILRERLPKWDWVSVERLAAKWRDADTTKLLGAWRYPDACADDARLVWRLIDHATRRGALAMTYVRAEALLQKNGRVHGVRVHDVENNTSAELYARLVVNATGAWADALRVDSSKPTRYRQLRGSHLVFDASRAPSLEAAAFRHPVDGRYLFALPWEGKTVLGITDLDHDQDMQQEPHATADEITYLFEGADCWLPKAGLTLADVVTTFSGVRGVIGTGRANTYKEKRDTVVEMENGMLTVTAGKLTGFQDTVRKAMKLAQIAPAKGRRKQLFESVNAEALKSMPSAVAARLMARYGDRAMDVAERASSAELRNIADTPVLWVELKEALHNEHITHLDDLLLRRTRVGQILRDGGASLFNEIERLCIEGGWNARRWETERERYLKLWQQSYASNGSEPALARQA